MENIKERYKRFKEWEQQPHEVAPLSEDEHVCHLRHTLRGQLLSPCGQSARIGRYSFKKALLLFLDVWGVGNRGMFRSLRDLILRPGYMIRDYLRGMQMAYFPPFKMFFLLFTLTILIQSGMNIKGLNYYEQQQEEEEVMFQGLAKEILNSDKPSEAQKTKAETKAKTAKQKRTDELFDQARAEFDRIMAIEEEWIDSHESFFLLIMTLLFSWPLWLLIRHCPAIPDMRLSECFVAMVYISNMLTIYSLIPSFLCFSLEAQVMISILCTLLFIIPIKQLSLQLLAYDLASRRSPHSLLWYVLHTDVGPNGHTICVCTNQTHLVLIPIGFRRLGSIFQ